MTWEELLKELERYGMSIGMFVRLAGIGKAAVAVNHWKRIKTGTLPPWVRGWFNLWENLAPDVQKRLVYSVTTPASRRQQRGAAATVAAAAIQPVRKPKPSVFDDEDGLENLR